MKVAAVQMDVFFGKTSANVARVVRHLNTLKTQKVDLAVFPEAALTGYCVDSVEEARAIAIEHTDKSALSEIQRNVDSLDLCAALGYTERVGDELYNVAAFFEPGQPLRTYRKTHLPFLGFDRFAQPGDRLEVWNTRLGRIAMLICFDLRFPEAARTVALKGAELIILPTNWPIGAEVSAEHIAIARAAENKIYLVACNRVGTEGGFRFIGKSKIIDPSGRVLAGAEAFDVIIVAEVNLAESREKRRIIIPGKYETETFSTRRVDLYTT
jgi:predicted amidohydrolase